MHVVNAEKKTFIVIVLTLVTMIAEIIVGYITHSMALFADGWHMGTHALALSLTYFTYILIRKFADSKSFVFGTGKFGTLAGFTSSILLGVTGIFIIAESVNRFFNPLNISVNEAIAVAIIGFVVNFACILVMGGGEHHHGHCGECSEHVHDEDFNFKAAYMHILADTMTSVFAIIALVAAKYAGLFFLDPIVGFVGGTVICIWAYGLIKSTSMILLDSEIREYKEKIREVGVFDELHVWKTSEDKVSVIGRVNTDINVSEVKSKIAEIIPTDLIFIERN